jgi:hypothetical protein
VAFTIIPVAIARCATLGITKALNLKCSIRRRLANVDLEVEGDIHSSVIHEFEVPANLTVASQEVILLPLPEDTVNIGAIQIEESKCVSIHRDMYLGNP